MARELAVVLANGSLQSAVACALAAQKHRIVMIFAETSATAGRPSQAFDALVQQMKPYRSHRVPMPFLSSTARDADSRAAAADPRSGEGTLGKLVDLMPIVATGLRYAIHYNAASFYIGSRVGPEAADLARVTEYGQLWAEMVQMTCDRPGLEVMMPLLELEPWQVVDFGMQVGAPMQFSWSCEKLAGEPCGECHGCNTREAAFQRAGRADPAKAPQKSAV